MKVQYSSVLGAQIGIIAAVVYEFLVGWIFSNANNKRMTAFVDGKWWTYGAVSYYTNALNISERSFRRAISTLIENDYLQMSHKGKKRTLWFCLGSKIPDIPIDELPYKGEYAKPTPSSSVKLTEPTPRQPSSDAACGAPKQSTLLNMKNNNKQFKKVVDNENQLINKNQVEEKNEESVVVDSFNNNCIEPNVTMTPNDEEKPTANSNKNNKADNSTTTPATNPPEVAGFSTLGSIIGSMQAPNNDANGSLFKAKKVILPGDIQFQNPTNPEVEPLLYLADSVNVERPTVLKFVKNFGFEATLKQLCHLHNVMLKKTVKVPGAWLCTALKNNFDDNAAREKQKEQEKKTRIAREKKAASEKAALARAEAQAAFEETHKSDTPVTYGAPGPDGFLYEISLRRMKRESPGKWDAWPTNFTAMLNLVLDPKKREPLFAPVDENYRKLAIERALAILKPYEAEFIASC